MIDDSARLFDIAARLALVADGAKASYEANFRTRLRSARMELREILARNDFARFDGLTKAEFDRLVGEVERAQRGVFDAIEREMLSDLKSFVRGSAALSLKAAAFVKTAEDDEPYEEKAEQEAISVLSGERSEISEDSSAVLALLAGGSALLAAFAIPANGMTIERTYSRFTSGAVDAITAELRKARANGEDAKQALERLLGKPGQVAGKAGVMSRIESAGVSAQETGLSHALQIVSSSFMSMVVKRYTWISVLDDRTSRICEERAGVVYEFGKGPLPPAHYNCRSSVAPVNSSGKTYRLDAFSEWVEKQPKEFISYSKGGKLRGEMADKAKAVLSK